MIVIHTYTVHHHTTVMIILNAAAIAYTAVVHSWHLISLTCITESKLTIIFHLVIYHIIWLKRIVK